MAYPKKCVQFVILLLVFISIEGCVSSESSHRESPQNNTLFREENFASLPYSLSKLEPATLQALKRALPDFMTPALIDSVNPVILAHFPLIPEENILDFFNEIKRTVDFAHGRLVALSTLKLCGCSAAPFEGRILTILTQVQAFLEKVPAHQREDKFVHISFGEEFFLQTYLLANLVSKVGFRNVEIYAINPVQGAWDGHQDDYKRFFTALPGIHEPRFFSSSHNYLEAVKQGQAFPAHSFDMIDVEPFNSSVGPTFIFSALVVREEAPDTKFFLVSTNIKTGSVDCVGSRNEFGIADDRINEDFIGSFCRDVVPVVSGATSQTDFERRLEGFSTVQFRDIRRNFQVQVSPYASAWFDFALLVSDGRAPETNPIILTFRDNIVPGPVVYQTEFDPLEIIYNALRTIVGPSIGGYPRGPFGNADRPHVLSNWRMRLFTNVIPLDFLGVYLR
jgi:hypothetical protein